MVRGWVGAYEGRKVGGEMGKWGGRTVGRKVGS